jgi:NurA-like 5'-3' nuclease
MRKIAQRLEEIEMTARSVVENAEKQKHDLESMMQKKRDQFDKEMEEHTKEQLEVIRSELQKKMERLLKEQETKNNDQIEFLKKDFECHHTDYAEEILARIIEG